MPRLLRDLAGTATIGAGITAGREAEHSRQRKRLSESRQDEQYQVEKEGRQRATERANQDQEDFRAEIGARKVASEQATPAESAAPAAPASPVAPAESDTPELLAGPDSDQPAKDIGGHDASGEGVGTAPPARTLSAAAGAGAPPAQAQAPAGPVPAGEAPQDKALWLRTAEAQRDYWTKKGRPDRANKVMVDAYRNAAAEDEVRHKFEIQPQLQRVRDLNLTTDELQKNEDYQTTQQAVVQNQLSTAGKVWGLYKIGATKEALDMFNSSGVLQPGVKAASIQVTKAKGPSGDVVDVAVMRDEKGEVVTDKNGRELIYPVQALDAVHRMATSSNVKLHKGESIYRISNDPASGATSSQPVVTAPDPAEERRLKAEERRSEAEARRASTGEDAHKDRLRQQARDAVKNQLFSGQTMMDRVDPHKQTVHGRAAPIAEKYVDDGMKPGEAAQKAIAEVEDTIKRERFGAVKKDGPQKAPVKTTVKDIIGG